MLKNTTFFPVIVLKKTGWWELESFAKSLLQILSILGERCNPQTNYPSLASCRNLCKQFSRLQSKCSVTLLGTCLLVVNRQVGAQTVQGDGGDLRPNPIKFFSTDADAVQP